MEAAAVGDARKRAQDAIQKKFNLREDEDEPEAFEYETTSDYIRRLIMDRMEAETSRDRWRRRCEMAESRLRGHE